MYRPDVVSLKQFYASPLGQAAWVQLWKRVHMMWQEASGETLLGLGYAAPYCSAQPGQRELSILGMPAPQGALYWPGDQPNRVTLVDEERLPFADSSFNRVLMIHALEHCDVAPTLMQEIWRVLVPGGRVLAVVPNRWGFWSHSAKSPFGEGRPFSAGQIRHVLTEAGFTPLRVDSALYLPPTYRRSLIGAAGVLEIIGQLLFPRLGGVLLVEAEKQIYASLKQPAKARAQPVTSAIPVAAQPA